jgi:secreted trypsin-like serine protease
MGKGQAAVITALLVLTRSSFAQPVYEMAPIPESQQQDPLELQILRGKPAVQTDWPATLQFERNGAYCTSTIVGERVLLTAAHCVENGSKARAFIKGTWKDDITCYHPTQYSGPGCNGAASVEEIAGCTADIALCLADTPFESTRIEAINSDPNETKAGASLTLLGFGCTKRGGSLSKDLMIGFTKVTTTSVPGASSNPKNVLQEYVIAEGGAAVCSGDSGGAAYNSEDSAVRKIVGVGSRGNLSTTSYLTNVTDQHISDFLRSWSSSNGADICGISAGGKGC